MDPSSRRVDYLDAARGLAALCVMFGHLILCYGAPDYLITLQRFLPINGFWDGSAAVLFFFVLSGFVLALPYAGGKKLLLGGFLLRRVFRLLPAYFVFILLSLALKSLPAASPTIPSLVGLQEFGNTEAHWSSWLLWEGHPMIPQSWSLVYELRYSLLLPFLILLVSRSSMTLLIFMVLLRTLFGFDDFVFHFGVGVCIAQNREWFKERARKLSPLLIALFFFGCFFLYSFRWSFPRFPVPTLTQLNLIKGLGAAGILVALLGSPQLQRFLDWKGFFLLGRYSYGIYLGHLAILRFVIPHFLGLLNQVGITDLTTCLVLSFVVLLALSIAVAWGVYWSIESPAILLGRYLTKPSPKASRLVATSDYR